jgi:hypothetical protein
MFIQELVFSNPDLFWGLVAGSCFVLGFATGLIGTLYFMSKSKAER